MKQYLDLLKHVRHNGILKDQRAKASDGSPLKALSIFGAQFRHDLNEGFPLLTTKKLPWKAIVTELLWFLRGDTNIKYLQENNCNIWNEWAEETGNLGPVYGKQWRAWKGIRGDKIDQVANLVRDIKEVRDNPTSSVGRRLIISSWNPGDMPDPKVPTGCHTLSQFNLTNGKLSCHLYQRSGDLFLGVPFNTASYSLLTHMLAYVCNIGVGDFIHSFGDVHIYENHLEQVDKQLTREPKKLPTLKIGFGPSIDHFKHEYLHLENYDPYPSLPGEVAI
jgi:thymidylate synthase